MPISLIADAFDLKEYEMNSFLTPCEIYSEPIKLPTGNLEENEDLLSNYLLRKWKKYRWGVDGDITWNYSKFNYFTVDGKQEIFRCIGKELAHIS